MSNAADQVMDLIFGRWRSQTLSAGTELGIFDNLDRETPKKPDRLAAELGLDPTPLHPPLRAPGSHWSASRGCIARLHSHGYGRSATQCASPVTQAYGAAGGRTATLRALEAPARDGSRR